MLRKLLLGFSVLTALALSAQTSSFVPDPKFGELYGQRATLFDQLGVRSDNIVMLGNSLTHGCEWRELLGNPLVVNRGINGDTADHNYDKALPWPFDEEDYIDVVTGRVAREQLEKHPADKPFYMKVSFCVPHKPYDAPQRYLICSPWSGRTISFCRRARC